SEKTRLHIAARRRGGRVAARGASAAAGETADRWVHWQRHTRRVCSPAARVPGGFESDRLYRRPECGDRISLGLWPERQIIRIRGRSCSSRSSCNCRANDAFSAGGKSSNENNPNCLLYSG